ncbi:MAG: serine hydrolase domain-containing protein [Bacteroidota bacterium]
MLPRESKHCLIQFNQNRFITKIKAYGYANQEEGRKVDTNTLFQAASISKSINSLGLLKLAEQGKIHLDTNINTYLKTWKFPYKKPTDKITTRLLLAHVAGTSVSGFLGYERTAAIPSLIEVLDGKGPANSKPVRLIEKPGKRFIYSGGGTTISQALLADVTAETYEDFMKREILKPLNMLNSTYSLNGDSLRVASGYHTDGKKVKGNFHLYPELAAAGLWTTPTDLANYIIECQLALEGRSAKVLSQQFMKERFTPVLSSAESKIALGVFLHNKNGVYYFNHNGGNYGFSCTSWGSLEKGYGVIVMTNSDNHSFMQEVCNSVARVYEWDRFYIPQVAKK